MENEQNPPVEEQGNSDTQEDGDGQNQSNELETLRAQKQHWKEKYQRLEEESKLKGETKTEPNKPNTQNEPDYSKIAFLNSLDVRHPDDQKVVMDEAERLKLPLNDVLGMEYVKAKLKDAQNTRKAEDAMPKGTGRNSGQTKGDVDYWTDKKDKDGNYQTPDDIELASKVIDARMKREKQKNMFSDDMF